MSSRVSSPFHVPASQAAEPEMHKAAEAMKSLRKATVNRFTHAPSLPKSQEELQPTNSVFVPVQAMQDHPSIPLQVATTETHTEPPASSTSHALVHADSFQTRVNDRNHSSNITHSFEREPDYQVVSLVCRCFHANDYSKIVEILSPVRSTVAVSFGLGLAHYKLRKFPCTCNKAFHKNGRFSIFRQHSSWQCLPEPLLSRRDQLQQAELLGSSGSVP